MSDKDKSDSGFVTSESIKTAYDGQLTTNLSHNEGTPTIDNCFRDRLDKMAETVKDKIKTP